jgi:DmsE family decaheme c-type cytochrome
MLPQGEKMNRRVFSKACMLPGLVLMLATGVARAQAAEEPLQQYASQGAKTCLKCHDEKPVTDIFQTAHAVRGDTRTPFAYHDCETCHGPSPEHMVKPAAGEARVPVEVNFAPGSSTPVSEQNTVCLNCHSGGERMHWRGSHHESAELACTSCHRIHAQDDKVRSRQGQATVCFTCHKAQRASAMQRSHHPLLEGQVTCSDCHASHGTFGTADLVGATVNDTCYQCHTEKRGPFLWEHPPVREDCTLCHSPHGSPEASLLKARAPWLCQECHSTEFHPSALYSGSGVPPNGMDAHLLLRSCLNCHPKVHGSNHPSGPRFTR